MIENTTNDWSFGRDIVHRFIAQIPSTFPAYSRADLGRRGFRSSWTLGIKTILRALAKERRLTSRCCGFGDDREFLFDLLWIDRTTKKCELVVESELGSIGDVADDFQKLLYAKSETKMMICDPPQEDQIEAVVRNTLEDYDDHRAGEHYLVLQLGGAFHRRVGLRNVHPCYTRV